MGLIRSFYYSFVGLWDILRTQRNARIHLLLAIFALALGLVLKVGDGPLAAVCFAIVIVFLAEIINTAFEQTLDLVHPETSPQVKRVKDMAAGAVLIAAIAAI